MPCSNLAHLYKACCSDIAEVEFPYLKRNGRSCLPGSHCPAADFSQATGDGAKKNVKMLVEECGKNFGKRVKGCGHFSELNHSRGRENRDFLRSHNLARSQPVATHMKSRCLPRFPQTHRTHHNNKFLPNKASLQKRVVVAFAAVVRTRMGGERVLAASSFESRFPRVSTATKTQRAF